MLWYKTWLETRWRFLIGLAILLVSAAGTVTSYRAVEQLMPLAAHGFAAAQVQGDGVMARLIRTGIDVQRDYRGFVWWQWFRQNLAQLWTLFAILLGSGGLISTGSDGAALFTLSLPMSRSRVLGVRAAIGLGELLALAIVPSLLIPLLSPGVGQHYALLDALVHGACLFVAGAVFFSLALFVSTVFGDIWRPLLLACLVAVALAASEILVPAIQQYGLFRVMSAESYFRARALPWPGLFASAAVSAALLYGAARNFAQTDL